MSCLNRPIYVEDLAPYAFVCDENGLIRPSLSVESYASIFMDDMFGILSGSWMTRVSTGYRSRISRDNGWFEFTTGALATNEESIDFDDALLFTRTKQPAYSSRIKIININDCEVELGLIGALSNSYIRFFYDYSSGVTNWRIQTSDAGVTSSVTTAIPVSTNEVELSWRFNSDTEVEFFIDGTSVGTIGINVPIIALQPYAAIRTEINSAKTLYIDYVRIIQDRT